MKKIQQNLQKAVATIGVCSFVVMLSASCSSATIAKSASIRPASAAGCPTSSLVVWLNTQSNGAAGSIYYKLEFTNLSNKSCSLTGYSGVSAVNLAGQQLGSAATRNPTVKAKAITIAPGGTANETLQIVEAANYPSAQCSVVTAAGLRVFPPNQTVSKVVPFPFVGCAKSGPTVLSVEVVQK